jgi:molybdopterin converting factor small subunit
MNQSESPNSAIEQSEKTPGTKEALRTLALSGMVLASMAQIAEADGASQEEIVSCLEDGATQNIQMVTERFPELNQRIADFVEAAEKAMDNREYDEAETAMSGGNEVSETRYQNFAWISQMVDYCGYELKKLETEIDQAVFNGLDTSELESKVQSLKAVIENLDEVRAEYRDM